jgi:outer membrane protein OmpA-like peptidoglycan-associated protein
MKEQTLLLILFLFTLFELQAQINVYDIDHPEEEKPLTKTHQWEFGLHSGHFFSSGNIDFIPGYGAGLHIRRATDYVFSLRLDLMYGNLRGEDPGNTRSFQNNWFSGSLQGVASLNNLKWNSGERKSNFYALAGFGANSFEVELTENDVTALPVENDIAMHADLGAGIAFKITEKLNIGLEHKVTFVFGGRSDLPDGVQTFSTNGDNRGTFRDLLNYTSVRINFNIGKNATSAPLYWVNPLDSVMNEVQAVKEETIANKEAISDQKEENSTRNVREDSLRPILLEGDSEETAVDAYVETPTEESNSVEKAPGETIASEELEREVTEEYEEETEPAPAPEIDREAVMAEVEKIVEERLKDIETKVPTTKEYKTYLLLPTVYFDNSSAEIKELYKEPLKKLAEILQEDTELKLVVIGHADQTGTTEINDRLSFQRASNVIDYLMVQHNINRERLILQWMGERDPIVGGSHDVNRRVTFEKASTETNMAPPEGE